jgi:hypothetical protein
LRIAEALGATHTINTNAADLIQEITTVTSGEGTSIVMDTTGVPKLIEDGFHISAQRGHFFFVRSAPPTFSLSVNVIGMIGVRRFCLVLLLRLILSRTASEFKQVVLLRQSLPRYAMIAFKITKRWLNPVAVYTTND